MRRTAEHRHRFRKKMNTTDTETKGKIFSRKVAGGKQLNHRITLFILLLYFLSVTTVHVIWALMFGLHTENLIRSMEVNLLEYESVFTDNMARFYYDNRVLAGKEIRDPAVYTFSVDRSGNIFNIETRVGENKLPEEMTALQKNKAFEALWTRTDGVSEIVLDNFDAFLPVYDESVLPVRVHYRLTPDGGAAKAFGRSMLSVITRTNEFKSSTKKFTVQYTRTGVLFTLSGFFVIAVFSRIYLRKNIYNPLKTILSGIADLQEGNFDKPIKPLKMKEFQLIAEELNSLSNGTKMLIHEVHHRVKNNLQVIASMMSLQKYQIEDPGLAQILQTSIERIHAMSMIHEFLYKSEKMEQVSAENYLKNLLENLTYKNAAVAVETDLNIDPAIMIPNDILIPVGLILNELILNSYKHAFLPGVKNVIHCSFTENGEILLFEYRDEGSPSPDRETKNSGSMGMQIINALSVQLGSEPEICYQPSFSYRLSWKKRPEKK